MCVERASPLGPIGPASISRGSARINTNSAATIATLNNAARTSTSLRTRTRYAGNALERELALQLDHAAELLVDDAEQRAQVAERRAVVAGEHGVARARVAGAAEAREVVVLRSDDERFDAARHQGGVAE